jgi:hypothetical protein
MSLRAARNDSAGRRWPAGRTLRTNALQGQGEYTIQARGDYSLQGITQE